MKNLKELNGAKFLSKKDQKSVMGGGGCPDSECVKDSDCPEPEYQVCYAFKCYYYW